MNNDSRVTTPVEIDHERASVQRWPHLSEQEVRRLKFVVYLRQTGRIPPVRAGTDSAEQWPQFSQQELHRLKFVRHLRQTGRIPPASPVPADVDTLCASLLSPATSPASRPAADQRPERTPAPIPAWRSIRGGIPFTWAVYSQKYGTRRPSHTGGHQVER
jgi:hypothetical protein